MKDIKQLPRLFDHAMKNLHLPVIVTALLVTGCAGNSDQMTTSRTPAAVISPIGDVLIISATFGSGTHYVDVTSRVNELLRLQDTRFFARPEWLNADPTPGWNKALVIVYRCKGQRNIFTTGEDGQVSMDVLRHAAMR
jgi:hypothetical protein